MLDALELPAGEKAVLSLQLPAQFIIVFEPVTHSAQFIDVQGEPTKERQQLSLIYNKSHAAGRHHDDASRDRCGCRSTTRPACGCCRRCSSPPTRCIN